MTTSLRLELVDISKSYPAVKANDRVSLRVAAGHIQAVLGENGAGKSTLMTIIYGAVRPDAGACAISAPAAASAARSAGSSQMPCANTLFACSSPAAA